MKKIMLFGGIGLALVIVTAVGMYFVLGSKSSASAKAIVVTPVTHFTVGPTYTLQTRVVNLADPGSNRYLKVTAVLAFSSESDTQSSVDDKLKAREVVLQDILTNVLSDLTTDQLALSQGKENLKKQLMTKFATVLSDLHLTDIYFSDFVMQ